MSNSDVNSLTLRSASRSGIGAVTPNSASMPRCSSAAFDASSPKRPSGFCRSISEGSSRSDSAKRSRRCDWSRLWRCGPGKDASAVLNTLVGPTGFGPLTGLTLVPGSIDTDFYSVEFARGKSLVVETQTPAANTGEFVNELDPMVRLYDPDGNLIASDDNSAGDGRNAKLEFKVPRGSGGTYFIEVTISSAVDGTMSGEYTLAVRDATRSIIGGRP